MRRNGWWKNDLHLVHHGSTRNQPRHGHYSATKAGINGFIKSAAPEFSGDRITVNGVEPGNILTEGMASRSPEFIRTMEQAVPLGRLGTPRGSSHGPVLGLSDEQRTSPARRLSWMAGRLYPKATIGQALTELRFGTETNHEFLSL